MRHHVEQITQTVRPLVEAALSRPVAGQSRSWVDRVRALARDAAPIVGVRIPEMECDVCGAPPLEGGVDMSAESYVAAAGDRCRRQDADDSGRCWGALRRAER